MALCPGDTLQKLARLRQNSILLGGLSLSPRARDGLAPHRFSYLAVKAAVDQAQFCLSRPEISGEFECALKIARCREFSDGG
jgi:hypothetical protein